MKLFKRSLLATPVAAHLVTPAPSAGTGGARPATCVSRDVQSGSFFYIAEHQNILLPGTENPARDAKPARVAFGARSGAPRYTQPTQVHPGAPRLGSVAHSAG